MTLASGRAVAVAPGLVAVTELLELPLAVKIGISLIAAGLWLLGATRTDLQWPIRGTCAFIGLVAISLALLLHSALFLAVGLTALWGCGRRGGTGASFTFAISALAIMGIGVVYLQTAALWDQDLALPVIGRLAEALGVAGGRGYLFVAERRVHVSLLSPWPAVLMSLGATWVLRLGAKRGIALVGVSAAVLVGLRGAMVFLALPVAVVGHQAWVVLLLALVAVVLAVLLIAPPEAVWRGPAVGGWWQVLAGAGGVVLVALALARFGSPIREVVVDEAHGQWETTEAQLEENRFGRNTVYNYSLLRRWLEERYTVSSAAERPIEPSGDLVVLKTPTSPYDAEERRALRTFVRRGGGLLVFADHTDLFGSSSILNQVLADYGLAVEATATLPLVGVTRRFPGRWWNGATVVHPDAFLDLQTTATLRGAGVGGALAEAVLVDLATATERADYSNERRFGELTVSSDDSFEEAPIVALRRYGLGQVVVVTDSTPWSNFSLLAPGNREFLLGLLRLFERPPVPLLPAVVMALALLAGGMLWQGRPVGEGVVWLLAAFTVAWAVAAAASAVGHEPVRFRSGQSLVILGELSDISWETDIRLGTGVDKGVYSLFLSTMPRVGVYPEMEEEPRLSQETQFAAVINLERPVPEQRLFDLERWVRRGGTLLLMDDPLWRGSKEILRVLRRFGFGVGFERAHEGLWEADSPALPDNVFLLPLALLQEGRVERGRRLVTYGGADYGLFNCEPLWADDGGLVVLGEKQVGRGRVVVFLRSRVFSQLVMGDVWGGVEPGRYRRELYELEYQLLRVVIGSDLQ